MSSVYLFTFATGRYIPLREIVVTKARRTGRFAGFFNGVEDDIPKDFREAHEEHFKWPRGYGYWCWRPFLLLKHMNNIEEGDWLVNCDVEDHAYGCLVDYLNAYKGNYTAHSMPVRPQSAWCKRDTFIIMGQDDPKYYDVAQVDAGHSCFRKCPETIELLKEWQHYIDDFQCVSDTPNVHGLPNLPGFQEHRHDQAILTLLLKKRNWPDDLTLEQHLSWHY